MSTASSTSLMPGCYNVCYYMGDSWKETIRLRDANREPIDLTNATVLIHIKTKKTDTTPVETLTEGDGFTIGGDDWNEIIINKIIELGAGSYFWDLRITFEDASVRTILAGDFEVNQAVTSVTP